MQSIWTQNRFWDKLLHSELKTCWYLLFILSVKAFHLVLIALESSLCVRVSCMRWRCFSLVYRWQMWFSYLIMWLILIPFVLFTSKTRLIYRIKKRDVECLAWMELIKIPSDSVNDLALFLSFIYMYAPIRKDVCIYEREYVREEFASNVRCL